MQLLKFLTELKYFYKSYIVSGYIRGVKAIPKTYLVSYIILGTWGDNKLCSCFLLNEHSEIFMIFTSLVYFQRALQ